MLDFYEQKKKKEKNISGNKTFNCNFSLTVILNISSCAKMCRKPLKNNTGIPSNEDGDRKSYHESSRWWYIGLPRIRHVFQLKGGQDGYFTVYTRSRPVMAIFKETSVARPANSDGKYFRSYAAAFPRPETRR